MTSLRWPDLRTILCIGAHSDDIEIGAGATVLRLIRENPAAQVVWVVLAAAGARGDEARASAGRFLEGAGASTLRPQGVPGQLLSEGLVRNQGVLRGA